jgi:hypothetical protein
VGVGAGGEQCLGDVGEPPERGGGQRGLAPVVDRLGIGSTPEQPDRGVDVAVVDGQEQQGVALRVREVHGEAGVDLREELGVAASGQIEHPVRERERFVVQRRRGAGVLAHAQEASEPPPGTLEARHRSGPRTPGHQ